MAHTDRDIERAYWQAHRAEKCWKNSYLEPCETCDREPTYRLWAINDAEWRRDERRLERGRARTLMNRARNGHIDWDDLVIAYRRPYYW